MTSHRNHPELLSPAGDREAMRAAVANGADAVYFGLADFNARHRAANFTLEELPETMAYLHEHGVRGYVTFNTLVFSDELPQAVEYLSAILRAGADAVIVQDLGIVELLQRLAPGFPIHGSTQMTLTEPRGIEFVRRLGVARVILARELSLKEIGRITQATPLPVEVFVHGALCVAYSGQCLTSEAIGGRSANRGQCAQACRQPYELIVDGEHRELGDKAYLLSPQDLAAYDRIGELAELGVSCLKIEGRLKSAHYVAATTQTYRAALDAAIEKRPFALDQQQELDLAQSFSRGFTRGFLDGVNHQELVQGRFPKHRGVCLGRVVNVLSEGVVIAVDEKLVPAFGSEVDAEKALPIKPGDGVVFDEGRPEQDEQGGRVFEVRRRAGGVDHLNLAIQHDACHIELMFGRGTINPGAISVGARVWKTDDPALRKRLERSFSDTVVRQRSAVSVEIRGEPGQRLAIRLFDDVGHTIDIVSDKPLQAALKHPLTFDLVRQQFGRMGGTPFFLDKVLFFSPTGPADGLPVMAPKSVLNDLRRRAVERLIEKRRTVAAPRQINADALDDLRRQIANAERRVTSIEYSVLSTEDSRWGIQGAHREAAGMPADAAHLSVLCRTIEQLRGILDWQSVDDAAPPEREYRPELVYCDFEEVRLFREAVALCHEAGCAVALATPRVVKPGEDGLLLQIANCGPDGVLVRSLAALEFFREKFPGLLLFGDYSLNVVNELTADVLARAGLLRLTPGYDLNLSQLEALLTRIDPRLFEVVLHQHIPMFHMEHCVYSHVLSNGKDFHDCGRPCDRHRVELRDHIGEAHPLAADVGCRNTVFQAWAQSAAPYVPRLKDCGVRHFRVELLREGGPQAVALVERYARLLTGQGDTPGAWRELRVLNQVGLTRGTLEFE